jgi:hypothetical protein
MKDCANNHWIITSTSIGEINISKDRVDNGSKTEAKIKTAEMVNVQG